MDKAIGFILPAIRAASVPNKPNCIPLVLAKPAINFPFILIISKVPARPEKQPPKKNAHNIELLILIPKIFEAYILRPTANSSYPFLLLCTKKYIKKIEIRANI